MTALLERLRAALAPDYEVERELATGGMGIVFLGRDVALDRRVAIKVVRPDLATATAAERFLREARVLASLSHPNVVPVHRAGEAGGLSYYVMEYLSGETLASRLVCRPLPPAEAVAVACDVLAALQEAHAKGVVHRDVKPSNVFLLDTRAVLSDFGIAKASGEGIEDLTAPGAAIGSPDYMAPEQMVGKTATAATDLCAVGLLLYEALTRRRFSAFDDPGRADWTGVPRDLVPVLRRALAMDPAARWPDAGGFRRALRRARTAARVRLALFGVAALSLAAAAVALWMVERRPAPGAASTQVVIAPFRVSGDAAPPWLGDSLSAALVHALGANADFRVRLAAGAADTVGALLLEGRATVRGESLQVAVTPSGAEAAGAFRADTTGPLAAWERTAADLAYQVLLQLWSRSNAPLAGDLPLRATPRSAEGLRAFLRAELLFAHAQWGAAYRAYVLAEDMDRSCLVCAVRITDVARWLGLQADTARTRRYRAALDSFPPHYRGLIEASFAPPPRRLEMLTELTEAYRGWGFGWFVLGDEIFHRGPFDGRRRADALAPLERAAVLRPDFAPVWEHLAWVAIAEGDSVLAARALREYGALASAGDTAAATIGALLQGAFLWRFAPEPMAVGFTAGLLSRPEAAAWADVFAAPSYMLTFGTPRATLWLGETFAGGVPRAGLETTGLLAGVYGLAALGRPDSAAALARHAAVRSSSPALALFAAELPAALALADFTRISSDEWPRLAAPLEAIATEASPARPSDLARAAWMLSLLAHRANRGADGTRYRGIIEAHEPAGGPLAAFATLVYGRAGHGMPAAAVRRAAALAALDSADRGGDPFFRSLLHLYLAQWQQDAGRSEYAVRELRWHENNDFVGYPGLDPQAAEVDYSLGTLAAWRRARLLESLGRIEAGGEACRAYALVARLWSGAEERYALRADSAAGRYAALGCGGAP